MLSRNPVATLAPALAADPEFLLGHAATAWLYLLGTGVTADDEVRMGGVARAGN